MLKSSTPYIIYIILSVFVILFAKYINEALVFLISFYDYIDVHLSILFNKSSTAILYRKTIALVLCPLIITGTPALVYYAIKRKKMPNFIEATWLVWLIIVLGNFLIK